MDTLARSSLGWLLAKSVQQPLALAHAQDHTVVSIDMVLQAFAGPSRGICRGAGLSIGQQRRQLSKLHVAQCRGAPAGGALTQGDQALSGIRLHPARDGVRVDAEPTRYFGAAATLGNQQQAVQTLQQAYLHRACFRVAKGLANGGGAA